MGFRKFINDPVHGFITINDPLIYEIISHPWVQRLRRINQMAMSYLVYPGAVHSRLHHALGAYHLMGSALHELRQKGIVISDEEEQAAKIAILLHDAGHGPFSHALESILVKDLEHEAISLMIMHALNEKFNGKLKMAIDIFTGVYHKKFLHQLISGQLDVDRMDYLTRDSFFTGVIEGSVGCDRILKMLTVHNGSLMVEEKGIYSIENFLVARRLMYWQVYQHKTVLSAEMTLVKILERAVWLFKNGDKAVVSSNSLGNILFDKKNQIDNNYLETFCSLDDSDVMSEIKKWKNHSDKVISMLSSAVLDRNLLKLRIQNEPIAAEEVSEKREQTARQLGLSLEDTTFLVFTGVAENSLYNPHDEKINILYKDGTVRDISQVDSPLIHQHISQPVKKFYISCNKTQKIQS
ncbi:MAG: HD domain-containing protein [Bacteroidetes bacterium]|nr:HD domain-containing protein [Bacteroidota bacterium]